MLTLQTLAVLLILCPFGAAAQDDGFIWRDTVVEKSGGKTIVEMVFLPAQDQAETADTPAEDIEAIFDRLCATHTPRALEHIENALDLTEIDHVGVIIRSTKRRLLIYKTRVEDKRFYEIEGGTCGPRIPPAPTAEPQTDTGDGY